MTPTWFYAGAAQEKEPHARLGWRSAESHAHYLDRAVDRARHYVTPFGKTVHDAGCGFGDLVPRIIGPATPGAPFAGYIGTDAMQPMLEKARATYGQVPGVEFKRLDLTSKAAPDADVTFCIGTLAFHSKASGKKLLDNLWQHTRCVLVIGMWWDTTTQVYMHQHGKALQQHVEELRKTARVSELVQPERPNEDACVVLVKS